MIYTATKIILSGVIKDIPLRLTYAGICGNDASSKHKGVTQMHDYSWQPADDLIDPTECMDTEEYIAWVESQSEGA